MKDVFPDEIRKWREDFSIGPGDATQSIFERKKSFFPADHRFRKTGVRTIFSGRASEVRFICHRAVIVEDDSTAGTCRRNNKVETIVKDAADIEMDVDSMGSEYFAN